MLGSLSALLLLVALVVFIMAAFRVTFQKVDLVSAGLALLTAYWLFRLFNPPA